MAFLTSSLSAVTFLITKAFWNWLITDVFSFIGNYGWRIVVFTVCLKLLFFPIDFFNRKKSKQNARIMQEIKPEIEALEKRFSDKPQELMIAKRTVQKKHGYSMGMTCLTAIITMVLFISLWRGLTTISLDKNHEAFEKLSGIYDQAYEQLDGEYKIIADANNDFVNEFIENYKLRKRTDEKSDLSDEELKAEAETELRIIIPNFTDSPIYTDQNTSANGDMLKQYNSVRQYLAQKTVLDEYESVLKDSFLWVKNIWRPDTYVNPIPSVSEYQSLSGQITTDESRYNEVMQSIKNKYSGQWNGMFILVVLTVVLNFLNQFIVMRMQKRTGELEQAPGMAGSMKMMMYIMPIIMGFFALSYASAFTLYMVTNASMTLFSTFVSNIILKLMGYR